MRQLPFFAVRAARAVRALTSAARPSAWALMAPSIFALSALKSSIRTLSGRAHWFNR